jgi:putative hemolysin
MELLIILVLLVANGVFAMAEIALVSAKRGRLKTLADQGNEGARAALALTSEPERLLSTVQVGITVIGVLAGAFGGAALSEQLTVVVTRIPGLSVENAERISFIAVVIAISYLSLVIGELVPKVLAMRQPEVIACAMSRPMTRLSIIAKPLVWFLGLSTRIVVRLFGEYSGITSNGPTREEVHVLLREGSITGVIHEDESDMLEGVLDLRKLRAEEVMQPKPRITFLQADDTLADIRAAVIESRQEVFPVIENNRDEVIGTISLRELYGSESTARLRDVVKPAVFVPENQPALSLLESLRRAPHSAALVVDEFGTVRGVVTIRDVIEEVVGDLTNTLPEISAASLRQTGPDTWLADAALEIDHVTDAIPGLLSLVESEEDPFQTLAGFIMHRMDRLPMEGESFAEQGYEFEILDMDLHRIDKVLIRRLTEPGDAVGKPASAE